jgi:hypothetical protein
MNESPFAVPFCDDDPFERRRAPRFRFDLVMPAVLGRGAAMIHDISASGARVSHFAPQPLDMPVRLMFVYRGRRFYATGRVLSSRVKELGTGPFGATTYESRLRFVDCSLEALESLEKIVARIEAERRHQRAAVADGRGESGPVRLAHVNDDSGYFITCRLVGKRWVKSWSRDGASAPRVLSFAPVQRTWPRLRQPARSSSPSAPITAASS